MNRDFGKKPKGTVAEARAVAAEASAGEARVAVPAEAGASQAGVEAVPAEAGASEAGVEAVPAEASAVSTSR